MKPCRHPSTTSRCACHETSGPRTAYLAASVDHNRRPAAQDFWYNHHVLHQHVRRHRHRRNAHNSTDPVVVVVGDLHYRNQYRHRYSRRGGVSSMQSLEQTVHMLRIGMTRYSKSARSCRSRVDYCKRVSGRSAVDSARIAQIRHLDS